MKNYEKPVVAINEELAEGVYAASGAAGNGGECYVVRCTVIPNDPPKYLIQLNADHVATNHHSTGQVITVTFNVPVEFLLCNSISYVSGSGTNTLVFTGGHHNNNPECRIGLGDITVNAIEGTLTSASAVVACNYTCDEHDSLGNY